MTVETKEWTFRGQPGHEETYTYADRWPEGPWDNEPDKVQWADGATGLPCLAVRNRMGAWCGYVGLPAGHPFREAGSYDSIDVDVHGGLTYGPSPCQEGDHAEAGICHVVDNPADDDVLWIGFDCLHLGDEAPGMLAVRQEVPGMPERPQLHEEDELFRETYKPLSYVKAEVTMLAAQVENAWTKGATK